MRGRLGGSLLRDNLQEDMQETLQRLHEAGVERVPFGILHERTPADLVQTFNSLLFLVKEGHVDVEQPEFPRGEIYVTLTAAPAAATVEATAQ
jgi:chromatin segregation and condensation protein Rec8/ScpA/Scc1 (kleisin family)